MEMRWLTHLYLANNALSRIRPEIAQLTNLVLLDLSNNQLRTLPAEVFFFKNSFFFQLFSTKKYY